MTKQRVRLIVSDLDGTLLNSSKVVSEKNAAILREAAQKQGVHICLASGRMVANILPAAKAVGIDCYLIGYNGSMCVKSNSVEHLLAEDSNNNAVAAVPAAPSKPLFHRPLPQRVSDQLIDFCIAKNLFLTVYVDNLAYGSDTMEFRDRALTLSSFTGVQFNFIPTLRRFHSAESNINNNNNGDGIVTSALIISDGEQHARAIIEELRTVFPTGVHIVKTECANAHTEQHYVELLADNVNKGTALATLAAELGVAREEVVAFGDGENDLEMVRWAGLGICMANGCEKLKAAASYVSEFTNQQDGVGREVAKLLGIEY